jgi:hypothetical protein
VIHLDALMRRLIHLRGLFPIVIGGTGRIAVVMLPQCAISWARVDSTASMLHVLGYCMYNKNTLTLSTPPSLFHGQKGIGRLTWQRILTLPAKNQKKTQDPRHTHQDFRGPAR